MSIENVKKQFNVNPAEVLANNLDWTDGKTDKKISASVWNEFVKDKGGKTIENSISEKNAVKSISVYLERESKETGKNKFELMLEWLSKIDKMRSGKKKSVSANPKLSVKDKVVLKELTVNERADQVAKYLKGETETIPIPAADSAAQVFERVIRNAKGKLPLNLALHFFLMDLYPQLVKQAKKLGIEAPAKVHHKQNASMEEICKDNLNACVALKNQILAAERNKAKKV